MPGVPELQDVLSALAEELGVPGVAAGVLADGETTVACHGVTSVENPLPVDETTLFQFGSTGKTFTAVALLRLVERGQLDLDAPVHSYVPELRLADEEASRTVTVLQLLNHTAGWEGDVFEDTGPGDDALAVYVERMAALRQVTPPGAVVSYNNASLALAGRLVEKATGRTFERALHELVLAPLALEQTLFTGDDVMTRRFVVGHNRTPDGAVRVVRPWGMPRCAAPMGGMVASVRDQLAWARFHLDGGRTGNGAQLLGRDLVERMREPTAWCEGSALGDAIGISWLVGDVAGVRKIAHGGSTLGQYSLFQMFPEAGLAIVSLTNCGPGGRTLNTRLSRWVREAYLGLSEAPPAVEPRDRDALDEYAGSYATFAVVLDVETDGGGLLLATTPTPEILAQLGEDADEDWPPEPLGFLAGGGDRWVVTGGPDEGSRGFFTRDASGHVSGVHVGGRYAPRI